MKTALIIALLAFASSAFAKHIVIRNYTPYIQNIQMQQFVGNKPTDTLNIFVGDYQTRQMAYNAPLDKSILEIQATLDGSIVATYKCAFDWNNGAVVKSIQIDLIELSPKEFACNFRPLN